MFSCRNVALSLALLSFASAFGQARAQFSYRSTIGNEAENRYQPGGSFAVKYRGGIITNTSLNRSNAGLGNFTRHTRLGESTGIGGSSLQTTSVTSESRPALLRPLSISTGAPLIERPTLNLRFESGTESPALKIFSVRHPDTEGAEFGRIPETFTNTSPLIHTQQDFSSALDSFQFGQ